MASPDASAADRPAAKRGQHVETYRPKPFSEEQSRRLIHHAVATAAHNTSNRGLRSA